jgi:hypothetical protein
LLPVAVSTGETLFRPSERMQCALYNPPVINRSAIASQLLPHRFPRRIRSSTSTYHCPNPLYIVSKTLNTTIIQKKIEKIKKILDFIVMWVIIKQKVRIG